MKNGSNLGFVLAKPGRSTSSLLNRREQGSSLKKILVSVILSLRHFTAKAQRAQSNGLILPREGMVRESLRQKQLTRSIRICFSACRSFSGKLKTMNLRVLCVFALNPILYGTTGWTAYCSSSQAGTTWTVLTKNNS